MMKEEAVPLGLSTPGRDRPQVVGDDFGARLVAEIAFCRGHGRGPLP